MAATAFLTRPKPKSRKELKQIIKDLKAEQTLLATQFEEVKGENEKLRQKTLFVAGIDNTGESSAEKLSRLLTVNVLKKTLEQKEKEFQRQLSVREEEIKQLRETKVDILETEELERLEPCDLRSEGLLGNEETQGDESSPSVALQTDIFGSPEMTQTSFLHVISAAVQTDRKDGVQTECQTTPKANKDRAIQTEFRGNKHSKQLKLSQPTLDMPFTPRNRGYLSTTASSYRALYEEKCGECESLRQLIRKQTPISQSYSELPVSFEMRISPIRYRPLDSPLDLTVEVKEAKLRARDAALALLSEELRTREKQVLALEQTKLQPGSVRLRRLNRQ